MPYADLFIAKKEACPESVISNARLVLLKSEGKVEIFKKGELVASEDVKNTDDETFASTLLYTLEKDFFPSADDDFSSYDVPLSILKEALRAL